MRLLNELASQGGQAHVGKIVANKLREVAVDGAGN